MNPKQIAGEKAVDFIKEGMIVGLGTGSTATYMIRKLGEKVKQGFNITAVSTSSISSELARQLGIPLKAVDDVGHIDLTIDGADEIDPSFNGIKGGGGALLFEKIVASISEKNIWVVDAVKLVDHLGAFPVPVEIVPFGYRHVLKTFHEMGLNPVLRVREEKIYKTDSDHYIIDLYLNKIEDVEAIDKQINMVPGVVENGLFINIVDTVIAATEKDFEILYKKK